VPVFVLVSGPRKAAMSGVVLPLEQRLRCMVARGAASGRERVYGAAAAAAVMTSCQTRGALRAASAGLLPLPE
jgi:hypothetical protein